MPRKAAGRGAPPPPTHNFGGSRSSAEAASHVPPVSAFITPKPSLRIPGKGTKRPSNARPVRTAGTESGLRVRARALEIKTIRKGAADRMDPLRDIVLLCVISDISFLSLILPPLSLSLLANGRASVRLSQRPPRSS